MTIIPGDFTSALQQANIDITKASEIGTTITQLISDLQSPATTRTTIADASLSQTISNIGRMNDRLSNFWINDPEKAHTTDIPVNSPILTTLADIHTSVVAVLEPAAKYSATLYSQLRAIDVTASEIKKYVYPKLSSSVKTNTVLDDMSLVNLKIYSSFLGVASKSSDQRGALLTAEIEMLQIIKSWLDQYPSELQRLGAL